MQIGNVKINDGLFLAPMAGVTDRAFRELCRDFGAVFCATEMVSSRALCYQDKKSRLFAFLSERDHPAAIQIFGDDPELMAKAAKLLLVLSPDIIDINMGCPAPKIASGGGGVGLMQNPALCGRIVSAVSAAVSVPVTVKIRSGLTEQTKNAPEVAKICEQAGAAAITVHGRTKAQMYHPPVDYTVIREVRDAVSIPVIGNGDVTDPASLASILQTGCDTAMVGRAACGNPWIFELLSGKRSAPPPLKERMEVMLSHISKMCLYKGERLGMTEARKHVGWYLSGIRNAAAYRGRAYTLSSYEELRDLTKDILSE